MRFATKFNEKWHKVFAWLPVLTQDCQTIWLEFVERKFDRSFDDPMLWSYIYRAAKKK